MASGVSKYAAVRDHLLARVERMDSGDQLPPESTLCMQYEVSRITLRHAVDQLVADGRLERRHGTGTFVAEPSYQFRYPEHFADKITGFHTQQTAAGYSVRTRVLEQNVIPSPVAVAECLGIRTADRVLKLVRVRYVNDVLHHLVTTYLPHEKYPGIASADLIDGSLFRFLEDTYEVRLARNDLLVSVRPADAFVSEHLGITPDERLLAVTSTVFGDSETAVTHGTSFFTPNNSEIAFGMHSPPSRAPLDQKD